MLFRLACAVLLAAVLLIAPGLVRAQAQSEGPKCFPQDVAYKVLKDFGETPAVIGLTDEGNMLILFSNPDKDTWTMGLLAPDKTLCLIGTGTDLQNALDRPIKNGRKI